ncbi:Peroxisome biosynthesis protein pex1 [Dimargaris xerosporica]|nr:Peroxisome biosynthesis protein pex1 [Dimargaris xerosporica]
MPHSAVVHLAPIRSCFANLPADWTHALWESAIVKTVGPYGVVLKLTWDSAATKPESNTSAPKPVAVVSWSGHVSQATAVTAGPAASAAALNGASVGLPVIEIDNALGGALGFTHGCPVEVDLQTGVPSCDYVEVEPVHADDWEIIELNAGLIEQALLTQVRLVALNQPLTFWVNDSTVVRLHVTHIVPSNEPHALLANKSEIAIAPKSRRPKVRLPSNDDLEFGNRAPYHCVIFRALVGSVLDNTNANATQQSVSPLPDTLELTNEPFKAVVTVHPDTVTSLTSVLGDLTCYFFVLQPAYRSSASQRRGKMRQSSKPNAGPTNLPVRDSVIVQVHLNPTVLPFYALVSDSVVTTMGITRLDRLRLSPWTQPPTVPSKIRATVWSTTISDHHTLTDIQVQQMNTFINTCLQTLSAAKELSVLNDETVWCDFGDAIKQVLGQEPPHASDANSPTSNTVCSSSNSVDQYAIHLSFTRSTAAATETNPLEPSADIGPRAPAFTVLDQTCLAKLVVETNREVKTVDAAAMSSVTGAPDFIPEPLGGIDALLEDVLAFCQTALEMQSPTHLLRCPSTPLALMLCGRTGSGKSSVCQWVCSRISLNNPLLSTVYIDCRELGAQPKEDEGNEEEEKGPISGISGMAQLTPWADLTQRWRQAQRQAPVLIVLDNLDSLLPAVTDLGQGNAMMSAATTATCHLFLDLVQATASTCPFMLMATCQDRLKVHKKLLNAQLFAKTVDIPAPNRTQRQQILQALLDAPRWRDLGSAVKMAPNVDLLDIAYHTEGYLPHDLQTILERSMHAAAMRAFSIAASNKSNVTGEGLEVQHGATEALLCVAKEDFDYVLRSYVPTTLKGVSLYKSDVQWTDIGGLWETKQTLIETLELPTKFSKIFDQCPLRLRSGILLYGYPGCGKTLLASAVAKECGLNFIYVKGPEILNKYIGASEQSVRDLFKRASAARPCVLFFDELDAIAPRRGHDNTGVTDRVVNQFLTEMDGAEGLHGVYVLAATSRPDLIDPALLRPGRLDKALLCDLPNQAERLDVS